MRFKKCQLFRARTHLRRVESESGDVNKKHPAQGIKEIYKVGAQVWFSICFIHTHTHSGNTHIHTHTILFSPFLLAISFCILEIWLHKLVPWMLGQDSAPGQWSQIYIFQSLGHCKSWTELEEVCLPRWRTSCNGSTYMILRCSKPRPFQDLLGTVWSWSMGLFWGKNLG